MNLRIYRTIVLSWTVAWLGPATSHAAEPLLTPSGEPKQVMPRSTQHALSPAEQVKTFTAPAGFRVELFAAEPDVVDPVHVAFDADGNVYVAEMLDYPFVHTEGMFGPFPDGQVRYLQVDEDGNVVKSTIFATAIWLPTSVLPYDGGVLVTAAPDILFLKDTDGDGIADVRETVLTGFDTHQDLYRVNSLVWGVDGWIYARGVGNTPIHWGDDPDGEAMSTENGNFRFRPRTREFEAVSGKSGCFGLTTDDWGRFFYPNSSSHLEQIVLPKHYLKRNSYLSVPSLTVNISDHGHSAKIYPTKPPPDWRVERAVSWEEDGEVERYGFEHENKQDFMTGTSGGHVYRSRAFPAEYYGNYFVCECVHGIVHRDVIHGDTPRLTGSRAGSEAESEFVSCADPWSSFVGLETGPDGALYIVDMYRQIIEHAGPDGGRKIPNVPYHILNRYGLRAGSTLGRVFRLVHEDMPAYQKPRLSSATSIELAATLGHADAWHRSTAQRLLLERRDELDLDAVVAAIPSVSSPEARCQILWTLHALGRLHEDDVVGALNHASPELRVNGLRMADELLRTSEKLQELVLSRANDPDPWVRFQLAFSLGQLPSSLGEQRRQSLVSIAAQDFVDPATRVAILSSAAGEEGALFGALVGSRDYRAHLEEAPAWELLKELSLLVGARLDVDVISAQLVLCERLSEYPEAMAAALTGLGDGIRQRGRRYLTIPDAGRLALRRFHAADGVVSKAADSLTPLIVTLNDRERAAAVADAVRDASNVDLAEDKRIAAAGKLLLGEFSQVREALGLLLDPRETPAVQQAAIDVLGDIDSQGVVALIVERWGGLTPELRDGAMNVLLSRKDRFAEVIKAFDRGDLPKEYALLNKTTLLSAPDEGVQQAAKQLFDAMQSPASATFEQFKPALSLTGSRSRGAEVFTARCASCHRAAGEGHEVGPDLRSVKGHSPDQILRNIVDPSLTVQPDYVQYMVETQDGELHNGVLLASSTISVTLRNANGVQLRILREDIVSMANTRFSLMPEGLLAELEPQQVADLIAFIKAIE